jgi:ATP-dependent Clp protease adaptor protein ClpS
MKTARTPQKEQSTSTGSGQGDSSKTILFNDNVHTFEEVARQLVKATRCPYSKGMAMATTVHELGSAIVYIGHKERCEAVAMVLEEIGLKTAVD